MNQTPLYVQAALTTESISKIRKQVHRTESRLWILKKAVKKVHPYCLSYKTIDIAEEIIRTQEQAKSLRESLERAKKETPKALWYPRRKYSGRYNSREEEIKTKIMKDCIRYGFNIKQVASYFNLTLPPVYRRINIKLYTQVDETSIPEVRKKRYNLQNMITGLLRKQEVNWERVEKLKADLEYYRGILRELLEKAKQ